MLNFSAGRAIRITNCRRRDLLALTIGKRMRVAQNDFRTGSGLRAQAQPFGLGPLSRIAPPVPHPQGVD